jgi:hypothetical protein
MISISSVIIMIAIGIGLRLSTQRNSISQILDNHAAFAQSVDHGLNDQVNTVPTSSGNMGKATQDNSMTVFTPIPPENSVITEKKAALLPITYRSPLYNSEIQKHLNTKASTNVVNRIEMSISNFYQQEGHLFVGVCFNPPGDESWVLGATKLSFANGELDRFIANNTVDQKSIEGASSGQHCDALEFVDLPQDAELSHLRLTVYNILPKPPDEGQECNTFNNRLASSMMIQQNGIQARCIFINGQLGWMISTKPSTMGNDEAMNIVGQESSGMILGPWVFSDLTIAP